MLKNIPFVRDVATLQLGRFVGIACGFATSIAYVRFLGLENYGQYAVIMAFAGVFGIITNLGQQATFTTFFSKSYGEKNSKQMQAIAQYYFYTSIIVALFLCILILLSPVLAGVLYDDHSIGYYARLVFISSVFELGFSYVSIVLQVTREIRLLAVLENTKIILQVSLAVALLWFGFGILGILLSSLIASMCFCILACCIYSPYARKYQLPSIGKICNPPHWSSVWQYTKAGIWIAIDKNIGNLYPTVFIFALSFIASTPVIGLIRLAFKLASLPASFALSSISRLASSVLPTVAGRSATELRQVAIRLSRYSITLHAAITIAGIIFVPIFLPYVYGPHTNVAAYPFIVFASLHITQALHAMITPIFRLHNKTYIPAIMNVIGMSLAVLVLCIAQTQIPVTRALYCSLAVFHIIILLSVFPAWKLLQKTE